MDKRKIKNRELLLKNWLYAVIQEDFGIFERAKKVSGKRAVYGIYAELQDKFLIDAQKVMSSLGKEILLIKETERKDK